MAIQGTSTKMRGGRAHKKMCNNAKYNLIADSLQNVARCVVRFYGPERKRCDELALEITSQKNTLILRNNDDIQYILVQYIEAKELLQISPVSRKIVHNHLVDDVPAAEAISGRDSLTRSFLQFIELIELAFTKNQMKRGTIM